MVTGPNTVVDAIAAGRRAAVMIDRYLRNEPLVQAQRGAPAERLCRAREGGAAGFLRGTPRRICRASMWMHDDRVFWKWRRRSRLDDAMHEARRCLRCDLEFVHAEKEAKTWLHWRRPDDDYTQDQRSGRDGRRREHTFWRRRSSSASPFPHSATWKGSLPTEPAGSALWKSGQAPKARLVTSCTYPAEEGLVVRTSSRRVMRARAMVIELLLASCPQSKTIQDLASRYEVRQQRFRQEHENCILCGRCVRMCAEQMMGGAIGFRGRGETRSIGTPFDVKSETVPAMRRVPVRLPGLRAPVYLQRTVPGNLRRVREPQPALPRERSV